MTKAITIRKEYESLVEECIDLLSERKFDLSLRDISWRHELGELIDKSKSYDKASKGSGEFIKRLSNDIGLSSSAIYDCIAFHTKYPSLSKFVESAKPEKKSLSWSKDVRPLLVSAPRDCEHEVSEEILTITRERCNLCGKVLSEKKEIQ
jgi:hypothetical protein